MLLKMYISFASSENVDRASTNLKHWSDQTRFSGNNNNNNKSLLLNPDMFSSQICKRIFPNWNALLTPVSGHQEVGCIPIFPPASFHTAHIDLSDIQKDLAHNNQDFIYSFAVYLVLTYYNPCLEIRGYMTRM